MTQTELLNTIRAEIMRLKLNVYDEANQFDIGARCSLTYLDSFLDTLPEQEHPIYQLNQILLDWMREAKTDKEQEARFEAYKRFFELYDENMEQEPEQPVEGLEEEIKQYFDGWSDDTEYGQAVTGKGVCVGVEDCEDIARHFAEWGAKHLKQ